VYRIYTEDKNLPQISSILNEDFPSYSVFEATGVWKGVQEKSLLIEIDGANATKVRAVAAKIKALNGQEAVLVQRNPVQSILL
jgi:hypothetical protein